MEIDPSSFKPVTGAKAKIDFFVVELGGWYGLLNPVPCRQAARHSDWRDGGRVRGGGRRAAGQPVRGRASTRRAGATAARTSGTSGAPHPPRPRARRRAAP